MPPNVYVKVLGEKFGDAWHEWEPETILEEIGREWSVKPSDSVMEKIMALQTFLTTDLFWEDPSFFENVILAFGDRYVDPDLIQSCTPEELSYGLTVANLVRRKTDFSKDIVGYIQACHRQAGQLLYHDTMTFAQPVYHDWRQDLVDKAKGILSKGGIEFVDMINAAEVQQAKTRDCDVYVKERFLKAEV